MTNPPPPNQGPPAGRAGVPLEYGQPNKSLPPGAQFGLGCVISLGTALPVAFVAGAAAGGIGAFAAPLVVIVILGAVAMSMRKNPARKQWAAGIWTGIGIAVLVDGLCWAAIGGTKLG